MVDIVHVPTEGATNKGCACLIVKIEGARQLLISDLRGSSDPFAECSIINEREKREKHKVRLKARTETVKRNHVDPRWFREEPTSSSGSAGAGAQGTQVVPWFHVFTLDEMSSFDGFSLLVQIFDEDTMSKNDLLGSTRVPLDGLGDAQGETFPNRRLQVPPKFKVKHITFAGEISLSFRVFYFELSFMTQLEGAMTLAFNKDKFWGEIGCSSTEDYVRFLRSDAEQGISNDADQLLCRRYAYGANHPPAPSDLSTKDRHHWRQVYRQLFAYHIKCIRGGNVTYQPSEDILVGDILKLNKGLFLDVDCLVLRADPSFQVSEMRLTGEQLPKPKGPSDVVSAGSVVTQGGALAMATAVGTRSVYGTKLSKTRPTAEDLGVVLNQVAFNGSIGTSTYKQWVRRLQHTKRGYWLVSEGYLTKHRKSIIAAWLFGKTYRKIVSDGSHATTYRDAVDAPQWGTHEPSIFDLPETLRSLIVSGICLNTRGTLEETPVGLQVDGSDSKTDGAFLHFLRYVFSVDGSKRNEEQVVMDFEYANGVKSCIATNSQGEMVSYVLGFASKMKHRISHWIDHEGVLQPIGSQLDDVVDEFYASHMSEVVLGYKLVNSVEREEAENGLTLAGVFGIKYPTLETSQQAIRILRVSGLHVVLVTSQPLNTAMAVARESGIFLDKHGAEEAVMTGEQFLSMSSEQQTANALRMSVMGNASSGAKEALVKSLKLKFPVCFQGKSIGCIPAMKVADLGVAMHTADDSACAAAHAQVLDNDIIKAALLITGHKLWADI